MTFQTVGLPVLLVFIVITIGAVSRRAISRPAGAAWVLLWIVSGYAIANPSITVSIAHALGIGRGADLVFYCGILAMLVGFFLFYVRIKRLEREITLLVRHIAISEHERDRR